MMTGTASSLSYLTKTRLCVHVYAVYSMSCKISQVHYILRLQRLQDIHCYNVMHLRVCVRVQHRVIEAFW